MFVTPFWVTQDLGLEEKFVPILLSYRWLGTAILLIPLAFLSEAIGPKRSILFTLVLSSVLMFWMAGESFNTATFIFMVLGPAISSSFVMTDTLVQQVSETRRSFSNGVYRTIGAVVTFIGAPIAAFSVAAGGSWTGVLIGCSALFAGSALFAATYPGVGQEQKSDVRSTLSRMSKVLGNSTLLKYICIVQIAQVGASAFGSFAGLYATAELGLTVTDWSKVGAIIAGISIFIVMISAKIVEWKGLAWTTACGWLCAAVGRLTFAISDSPFWAVGVYAITTILSAVASVTFSLWLAKIGGVSASTFMLNKLASAVTFAIASALLGFLEPLFGMQYLLTASGLVTLYAAIVIFRFRPELH